MDFLTVEEVAVILKAHTNTVYKMCRQGVLPAVKIGPSWRIDRKKLATFMEGGTPPRQADSFKGLVSLALKSVHGLGIFTLEKDILDFELTYFATAMEQEENICYLKECWWQHPDDARRHLSALKIDVEKMESKGELVIVNMSELFRQGGVIAVLEKWISIAETARENGFKSLVGTGAKHVDCCDGQQHPLLEVENGIAKICKSYSASMLCTYFMDPGVENIFTRIIELAILHDQFFIQTEDTELMARVSYSFTHSRRR